MHVDNIIINFINNIFWKQYNNFISQRLLGAGLANDWKDGYAYIYFISSFDYRKWSIEHSRTYFIIPVIGAALLWEWCLFESGIYFDYG